MSTIYATGREAGKTDLERCTYYVACQLLAYEDPVPPGRMSVAERDVAAAEMGRSWADKIARGEKSSAWHEIHGWFLRNRPLPPCTLCGGPVRDDAPHALCVERQKSGLAVTRLDATPPCSCHPCSAARKPRSEA